MSPDTGKLAENNKQAVYFGYMEKNMEKLEFMPALRLS